MEHFDKMRELRIYHEMSQNEVAKALGTTQQYYGQYELGKRPLPSEVLRKLCILYNVSADYILGLPKGLNWPKIE